MRCFCDRSILFSVYNTVVLILMFSVFVDGCFFFSVFVVSVGGFYVLLFVCFVLTFSVVQLAN